MITDVNDLSIYVYQMNKIRDSQEEELKKIPQDLIQEVRSIEESNDSSPKIKRISEIIQNDYYYQTITGFSIEELTILLEKSEKCFIQKGRGRKYNINEIDLIVMLLHYLRRYPRFDEGDFFFDMNKSTYQKYIDFGIQCAMNSWY